MKKNNSLLRTLNLKKIISIAIFHSVLFYGTMRGQDEKDLIEVPLLLSISGNVSVIPSPGSCLIFFLKGQKIAEEKFSYYPYKITFSKKCYYYFEKKIADSVVMHFNASGLFGESYDYWIGFNDSISPIVNNEYGYFELIINDLYPLKKNLKLIEKLQAPYVYYLNKHYLASIEISGNNLCDKFVYFFPPRAKENHKFAKMSVDYAEYRKKFFSQ